MSISKKRIEEISKIKEENINYDDIPELDESFWNTAEVVAPRKKSSISLRVDQDVLEWFKKQGKGYQTKINAVLKTYMNAHR